MFKILPQIVEAFKGHDHPAYALGAIVTVAVVILGIAALAGLGATKLGGITALLG